MMMMIMIMMTMITTVMNTTSKVTILQMVYSEAHCTVYHSVLHAVSQYGRNVTSFTPIKVHPSLCRFSVNSKYIPKALCADLLYRISPNYSHKFGKYGQKLIYVLE
jgi:hypothetical protein